MKRHGTLVLTLVAAVVLVVGGLIVSPASAPVTDEGPLTDGQRKALEDRINNTVRERGMLESESTLRLSCGVKGGATILTVVRDGAIVKKGDVLVTFDDSKLQEELQQRQIVVVVETAVVEQAEAILTGRKREQTARMAAARLNIQAAEFAKTGYLAKDGGFAMAKRIVEREIKVADARGRAAAVAVKNHEKGTADFERAQAEFVEAATSRSVAQARIRLLETHTLKQKTAEHNTAVARAKADFLAEKNQINAILSKAERELKSHNAALNLAQSKLAQVRRQLSVCRIIAPRDGVVIHANQSSRRSEPIVIEEGTLLRERQMTLQMPDYQRLQMRVKVHETQIVRVKKGQTAKILIDAQPEAQFTGKVLSISRTAIRGDWPNNDLRLFDVIVSINKPTRGLRIGMSALVEIKVARK